MRKGARLAVAAAAGLLLAGCQSPKVTYKGLKLTRPVVTPVTAGDVARFIEQVRDQAARPVPLSPDTRLRRGHRAIIDFVGTIGGTPFQGGTATAFPVVLGSGSMVPGFEAGILGMRPGDVRDVAAAFPADYHDAALAGRKAVFRITVRAGESLVRPALDAEFARQVSRGQLSSVAELRTAARRQLEQQRVQQAETSLRSQVAEALLGQWAKEPSRRQVEKALDRAVQQELQGLAQRGAGPAQGGPDPAALRESLRPRMARHVKMGQVLARIAKIEAIVVSDGEVEQFAAQMAQAQGQAPQAFLDRIKQDNLYDEFRRRILEDRVMTLILKHAQVEEPKPLVRRAT